MARENGVYTLLGACPKSGSKHTWCWVQGSHDRSESKRETHLQIIYEGHCLEPGEPGLLRRKLLKVTDGCSKSFQSLSLPVYGDEVPVSCGHMTPAT